MSPRLEKYAPCSMMRYKVTPVDHWITKGFVVIIYADLGT
jgi:hypothetical protein